MSFLDIEEVMNTQTGGTPLPAAQELPKNIKPVQQATAPAIEEVNTTVNVEQPIVTAPATPSPAPIPQEKTPPPIDQEYVKQLYDYTNKYNLMLNGKPINYDKFASHITTPEGASQYYGTLIQRSKILPIPLPTGTQEEFIGRIFKAPEQPKQDTSPKNLSEFVRAPFTPELGVEEIKNAAAKKIDEVKAKYNISDQPVVGTSLNALKDGEFTPTQVDYSQTTLDTDPRLKQPGMTPDQMVKRGEENTQKVMEGVTLKNWGENITDGVAPIVDKETLPKFDLKLGEGVKGFTESVNKYNSQLASSYQMTDEEAATYGQNPYFKLEAPSDNKIQFDWKANLKPGHSSVDYWSNVSDNFDQIDNRTVDAYQNQREIKQAPAQFEKVMNDYWKFVANTKPEEAEAIYNIRGIQDQKRASGGQIESQDKGMVDVLSETFQGAYDALKPGYSKKTDFLNVAKKTNVFGGEKMFYDVENAFGHQQNVILGDYANGKASLLETEKALAGLEKTKEKMFALNPELRKRKIEYDQKQLKAQEEQEKAELKERTYRSNKPIMASIYYDYGGMGAQEGGKAVLNDFAESINLVTGGPSVMTTQMQKSATPEAKPISLQGSIYDEDGFHLNRLMDQVMNTTTQMGGLLIGTKGTGSLGKVAKYATGIEKAETVVPMAITSFGQSYDDYYKEAYGKLKEKGYSDQAAEIGAHDYALPSATLLSSLETLVPLPFTGKLKTKISDDYSALLKEGVNPFMARAKAIGNNVKDMGGEIAKQYGEEVSQEIGDKLNNAGFNERAGMNLLDADLTAEGMRDLFMVTAGSTLLMGGSVKAMSGQDLYNSPITKKAAIWEAVQDPGKFEEVVNKQVSEGKLDKLQATGMKTAVKEVKSAIDGLPSAKNLTEKQQIDLGLLIYEKKKLEESVSGGYVDELFLETKTKEIEGKKAKLNAKILEVYNQNDDRNKIIAEVDKLKKEQLEAQKYAADQLAETRARVLKNTEGIEEETVINENLDRVEAREKATRTPSKKPKTKVREEVVAETVVDEAPSMVNVDDGHHRYVAYSEMGIKEIPTENKETGEKSTIPIEQIKPTEPLEEKDRKVIDSLKEAIKKEEPIEPIKVVSQRAIGPNNDIAINDSTRKALNEFDFLKSKQDAGDKTFSPTKKYRGKIPFKGTGDRASANVSEALPIAEKEVRIALGKEGYSEADINTILEKSRKKEIIVNTRGEGIARREAEKVVAKKKMVDKPVGKRVEKKQDVTDTVVGKKEQPKSTAIYNEIVKNKAAHEESVQGIENDRAALREEADKSDNPEVKKGLSAIENALSDPEIKEPKDLKIDGELFGSWLIKNKQLDKLTDIEYNTLKERFSDLKDKFGKKEKAKTAIDRITEILKSMGDMKFVGTTVAGMNIFTIPINMPIAVVKLSAKVLLRGIQSYKGLIDYNKIGNEAVTAMRQTKWFQNLSPKERSAINKYIKEMEPFEAMVTIIDEAARDKKTTGEKVAKKVVAEINKPAVKIDEAKKQRKSAKKEQVKDTTKSIKTEQKRKDSEKAVVKKANDLRARLRKRMRSEGIGVNDKDMIGFMTSLDPRELFLAGGMEVMEQYNRLADQILNETTSLKFEAGTTKIKTPNRSVSNDAIKDFVEKKQALIEKYHFNEFKRKNAFKIQAMQNIGALEMNPSRQEIEAAFDKFNLIEESLEDEIKANAKKSPNIANKINEMQLQLLGDSKNPGDLERLKEKLDEGSFDEMSPSDKAIIENILKIDVSRLTPAQLIKTSYTINNIIVNKEAGLSGAGQVEAIAISHQTEKTIDEILKKHNLKTLRDIRESYSNINFKSTAQVMKSIALTNEIAAELQEALKMQELNSGYSNMMMDISKSLDQNVKRLKKKYGRAITRNPENRIRQGMYAVALQWQGEMNEDKNAWFEENKQLLEEDIKTKKESGKFNEEVAIEEKIFNQIFKNATSMDDLSAKMESAHPGDKAMVDLVKKVFESNKNNFEKASRIYGNQELDMWNNYTHRKWKENVNNKWQEFDPINKDSNIAKMIGGKHVNRKTSKSTIVRTEQWPDTKKVLNLDFFNVQNRMIHEAYYQAKTLGTRYAIKEIMENPAIKKQLGEKSHNIIKQRMIETINHQMGMTQQDMEDYKGLKKIINYMVRWQTAKALAGLGQAPLQFATALVGATVKNPFYINSTIANIFKSTKGTDLFKYSNMQSRANAYYEGGIENMKGMNKSPLTGRVSRMLNDIDALAGKGVELSLKPLQYGDFVAAKSAWMSYYKRKWKRDNKGKKFNWDEQMKNPDKTASAYADQMIQTSMNVNDIGVAGKYFRDQTFGPKMMRLITSPFASFAVNQDYRILDALRNLGSLNKDAMAEAGQDIASIMAEQITWQYMKAAIASAIAYGSASILPGILGGGDEEEKEIAAKRFKDVFTKEFTLKAMFNATLDFMPTAAIVPPFTVNTIEGYAKRGANELLGETLGEEYKNTFPVKGSTLYPDPNFEPDVRTAMGFEFMGMLGGALYDIYTTGKIIDVLATGYDTKDGDVKELSPYQRNVLTGRLLTNLLSFSTGLTNKEWDNMLKNNEYVVKDQLKKGGGKSSSGRSGSSYGRSSYGSKTSYGRSSY